MHFSLPHARYDTAAKTAAFYEQLLPRLRALPGVKTAGIVTTLPGQGYGGDSRFTLPEHPDFAGGARRTRSFAAQTPDTSAHFRFRC